MSDTDASHAKRDGTERISGVAGADIRKLVKDAFRAGYLANGPTNPFEMEDKAERYAAIKCDPPKLDRIIRPTGGAR